MKKLIIILGIASCAPSLIAVSKTNKSRIYQVSNPVSVGEKLRIIGAELQKGAQEADLGMIHLLLAGISPRYISYALQKDIEAAELAQNFQNSAGDGNQGDSDDGLSTQEVTVTSVDQDLVEEQGTACPLSLEGQAEEYDGNVEQPLSDDVDSSDRVEQEASDTLVDEQGDDSLDQEQPSENDVQDN